MSTCGKLNLIVINSDYLVLSSLEIQRRLMQTKLYCTFFCSVLKKASHKPSKVAATKSVFPGQLASMNVFYSILERTYFLDKFIVTQSFLATTMLLLSLKQVFGKEVRILCLFSLQYHYNAANTKGPNQSFYFVNILIKLYFQKCFLGLFYFV